MEVVYRVSYPALPVQLRTERERYGWSQQQLAVAAGLSIGVVRKVEQGLQAVELETVTRLGAALSLPVETLLGTPADPVLAVPPAYQCCPKPVSILTEPVAGEPSGKADQWDVLIFIYNAHKPSLWATCRSVSAKRQRALRPLLKQFGQSGCLLRLESALRWAAADEWWSSKPLDFDTLLRENRLVSWSERWESRPAMTATGMSFTQWYDRARGQGLVVGSVQQEGMQWVILPDDSSRLYAEMVQEYPLAD